jgi:bacillithiol biosynthesis cysteine-adding enzyme BshC
MGRPFLAPFLAGDQRARSFLPEDFRELPARLSAVRRAAARSVSPALMEVLVRQNAALAPSAARHMNLEALSRPGTTVVITGQQVGLFLGPLYTYYKAATAVAAARALERETGVRTVPLFWLQTEDHDFEEIATAQVLRHDGELCTLTVAPDPRCSPRTSIAHRCLGPDVEAAISGLTDALGPAPGAAEVVALMRAHYRPGVSLGRAFAGAIAQLFADDGLLVFDPRDPLVARLAVPLYRRALTGHEEITRLLAGRAEALQAAGFNEQIPSRRDCSLLFFHETDAAGPRYRLERRAGGERDDGGKPGTWSLAGTGTRVSPAEVESSLAADPLRFSTSALLRPVLQDTLFPTAAYVGGPAELGYFAQLGPLYDHFQVPRPLVVLRARFRCLDEKARAQLQKLKLRPADLEQPEGDLLRNLAENFTAPDGLTPSALAAEIERGITPVLERLEAAVAAVDPTLARPARATRAMVGRAVERLVDKYGRALARKDEVSFRRLARLRTLLFPTGVPQERFYGWPSIAARVGADRFARTVREAIEPFAAQSGELCP